MEFCFAIWISFARVSSNGKQFFHMKWQNVFTSAVCHNKRKSFRTYYTNKVSQSLTDVRRYLLLKKCTLYQGNFPLQYFLFLEMLPLEFQHLIQHVQRVPHLRTFHYRGFHYRGFHYRDFWLMYMQVGDFRVSRGPHSAPLTRISCNPFFFKSQNRGPSVIMN